MGMGPVPVVILHFNNKMGEIVHDILRKTLEVSVVSEKEIDKNCILINISIEIPKRRNTGNVQLHTVKWVPWPCSKVLLAESK